MVTNFFGQAPVCAHMLVPQVNALTVKWLTVEQLLWRLRLESASHGMVVGFLPVNLEVHHETEGCPCIRESLSEFNRQSQGTSNIPFH